MFYVAYLMKHARESLRTRHIQYARDMVMRMKRWRDTGDEPLKKDSQENYYQAARGFAGLIERIAEADTIMNMSRVDSPGMYREGCEESTDPYYW